MMFQSASKRCYPPGDSDDSMDDKPCDGMKRFDIDTDSDVCESDSNNAAVEEQKEAGRVGRKLRRRRRRPITICTANCRYDVVRRVAYRLGMKEVGEDESWNIFWTDLSISVERCKEMKRFQKINHFPGMSEICRKDLLARNLNRMLKLYPEEYSFFPKSWCLPADNTDLLSYSRTKRGKTYILKPDVGCQGRGIIITKSLKDIRSQGKMICQVYVNPPFLIDGYKFDFRVYTLITSCDPLRIFVYDDGLARFATSKYREPTGNNTGNIYMHLTNYAVNKHNRMFLVDDELGSKRKMSTLSRRFEERGFDYASIWSSIDQVIIKTIIAAHPMLKHSYNTCFPTHDYTYACFEILGFDILLDKDLKPYVLEVNHSPSFHTDSQIDRHIKEGLLRDTFNILNLQQSDKKKIIEEDRRRVRERLLKGIYKDQNGEDQESSNRNPLALQTKWEEEHMGMFRKIYPCEGCEKFDKFFQQGASSLFQDTAASRAREEASRVQREESVVKAKQEAIRRAGNRMVLNKLCSESTPGDSEHNKLSTKPSLQRIRRLQQKKSLSCSFEPVHIIQADEMERLYHLSQREFILKSFGVIEQIYLCLKKNRALRPEDELKYGKSTIEEIPFLGVKPKSLAPINLEQVKDAKSQSLNSGDMADKFNQSPFNNNLNGLNANDLVVRSNEATMSTRLVPGAKWPYIHAQSILPGSSMLSHLVADVRSTKAQVARTYSNNVKLKQLQKREKCLAKPLS